MLHLCLGLILSGRYAREAKDTVSGGILCTVLSKHPHFTPEESSIIRYLVFDRNETNKSRYQKQKVHAGKTYSWTANEMLPFD